MVCFTKETSQNGGDPFYQKQYYLETKRDPTHTDLSRPTATTIAVAGVAFMSVRYAYLFPAAAAV